MANKPADRTAEAHLYTINDLPFWQALNAHYRELEAQQQRNKPRPPVKASKPDKMHLYVDGKHKLSVDADKAHEVAETYAREGSSVWLTRKVVKA